jgi:hypothetical protein
VVGRKSLGSHWFRRCREIPSLPLWKVMLLVGWKSESNIFAEVFYIEFQQNLWSGLWTAWKCTFMAFYKRGSFMDRHVECLNCRRTYIRSPLVEFHQNLWNCLWVTSKGHFVALSRLLYHDSV